MGTGMPEQVGTRGPGRQGSPFGQYVCAAGQHWSSEPVQLVAGDGGSRQTRNPPGVSGTHCPLGQSAPLWQSPELGAPPPADDEVEDDAVLDALVVAVTVD